MLPDFLLERRLDDVEVIGRALVLAIVIGHGMRKVANQVNVPMTDRAWLAAAVPGARRSADSSARRNRGPSGSGRGALGGRR